MPTPSERERRPELPDDLKPAATDKPSTAEQDAALDLIAKLQAERGKDTPAEEPAVEQHDAGPVLYAQLYITPPRTKQIVQSPVMEMVPMHPRGLKLTRRQVKTLLKQMSQPGDTLYIGVSFLWPDKMPPGVEINRPTGANALPKPNKED